MKQLFALLTVFVFGYVNAQSTEFETSISPLQNIQYQGLSFVQKPYQRLNCEFANLRKKNANIDYWGDTVCSSVSFIDLEILGEDKPVITRIYDQIKELSFTYGESKFSHPQEYCNSIADTAAANGMIELSTEISVLDTFDKFIGINIGTSEFSGGAHPNYYSVVKVFDVFSGEVLELGRIIDKKFEKSFRKLLYVHFKKTYGLDALFNSDVKPDEFPIPENFHLGNNGMFLYYNPYEITPYAVGAPEITLTFSEISPYLTPYFKSAISRVKKGSKSPIRY